MNYLVEKLQNLEPLWLRLAAHPRIAVGSTFAALVGFYLLAKRRTVWILARTFKRDIVGLKRILQVMTYMHWARIRCLTIPKLFDGIARKYPNKVAIYYEDEEWTFKQLQDLSNRVANYFQSLGFQKGDVVALYMENCPEYPALWLGLGKLGVIPALINTNLRLDPLKYTIEIVNSKAVIYGEELSEGLHDLQKLGELKNVPMYSYSRLDKPVQNITAMNLKKILQDCSSSSPTVKESFTINDCLYYIYTSGTTGLPKATVQKHARFIMAAAGAHYMFKAYESDIWYTPMPLYHSGAGQIGIGQTLLFGTSFVTRKKFSASNYWKDCVKYNVTAIQYIGEICRYLIAQPPKPEDQTHKVRLMVGNGLRKEIWREFQTRFNVKCVGELYGSSEGNCNMVNIDGKVGAVGFVPRLLTSVLPYGLVRVDPKTGEILRNSVTGLAITCEVDEPGELCGIIVKNHPIRDFEGYADDNAKKSKIAHDVFRKGDAVFRSGDILRMDKYGYFYFQDRSGDTFRWKGENVSTAEVESVISKICKSTDCTVYGVQIPNTEGRAGMAAIAEPEDGLDFEYLCTESKKQLPGYARPLFLRLTRNLSLTGTFKYQKVDMQKEGFDVNKIKDKMYFLHNERYISLDETLYAAIMSSKIQI